MYENDYTFIDLLLRIHGKMFFFFLQIFGSKNVEILQNAAWSVNIDSLWPCRSLRCWSSSLQVWPSVTTSGTRRLEPTPGTWTTAPGRPPATEASSASGDTSSFSTPWCPSRYTSGEQKHAFGLASRMLTCRCVCEVLTDRDIGALMGCVCDCSVWRWFGSARVNSSTGTCRCITQRKTRQQRYVLFLSYKSWFQTEKMG